MVDPEIFTVEGEQTKQEEMLLHEILASNEEKYTEAEEDVINEFFDRYDAAYSPGTVVQRMSLGNKLFHSGVVVPEALKEEKEVVYKSGTQEIMYSIFTKINDAEAKKAVPIIPKKEKIVVSQAAIDNARKIVQFSFYSYMFFGVQNLFGLDTHFFGDLVLPYRPDIIIGAMPFYSAQKLERGMSDRILKYRAIGDIFLAHQRGGTDTLRADITLFGPYRGWYLLYLLALQQGGESRLKELELTAVNLPVPEENVIVPKTGKYQYESHMTFPIITQTAIMLDMYLQTIEWHQEKDRGGHSVIFIHLLFRKHINPIGIDVFEEGKKGYLNYGEVPSVRRRKELIYDTLWKCKQIGVEILKFGLFGGTDMATIDMEAITSDPYVTDIAKLMSGYSFDINNMVSIFERPYN